MTPHFKEQYTKVDDISLLAIFYFFSQANLVFISNPMFLTYRIAFLSLFTFLPFDYWYSAQLEFHPSASTRF